MSDILVMINGHNIVGYFMKHRDSGSHTFLLESPNSGYLSCRIRCLCYGIDQIQSVLLKLRYEFRVVMSVMISA
jgi:hypothetical protein